MNDTIHIFERAGLGKAPFTFVGVSRNVGPKVYPNGLMVGAPGQPMGSCDLCGHPIANEYVIRNADNRTFIVGSECVCKSGDAGLRKIVAVEKREKAREYRAARRAEKAKERENIARKVLAHDVTIRKILSSRPHPYRMQGKTMLDYCKYVFDNPQYNSRNAVDIVLQTREEMTQ